MYLVVLYEHLLLGFFVQVSKKTILIEFDKDDGIIKIVTGGKMKFLLYFKG